MMSVATIISRKISHLMLGFLALFRRLLCFLNIKRGRKNSGTLLPMTIDPTAVSQLQGEVQSSLPSNDIELESWESWGQENGQCGVSSPGSPAPFTVVPSIDSVAQSQGVLHAYLPNHLLHSKAPEPEEEPAIDFFQDMTPEIRRTKKITIRKKEDSLGQQKSSRLAMTTEIPTMGSELDIWDEGESAWAEEANEDLSWEADSAIKARRLLDREQRQMETQRKKMERAAAGRTKKDPQLSAVRLS